MNEQNVTDLTTLDLGGELAPVDLLDGNTGFGEVDRECRKVIYLKLAADNSEYVKRGSAKKIDDLLAGQFFCPATKKIYGDTLKFIILKFYRNFSVYESKEQDAKWLGMMSTVDFKTKIEQDRGTTRERSYYLDKNGHRYVDNRNFIVLPYPDVVDGPMLITLNSSNIKASKDLLTMAQSIRAKNAQGVVVDAPIWSSVWQFVPSLERDPKNNTYYCITKVARLGWTPRVISETVKDLFDSFVDATIETGADPEDTKSAEDQAVASESDRGAEVMENVFGKNAQKNPTADPGDLY